MNYVSIVFLLLSIISVCSFSIRARIQTKVKRKLGVPKYQMTLGESSIVDPSFNLAAGSLVIGTAFGVLENFKGKIGKAFGAGAILFTLFGAFVAYQTATLRFKFDEDSFSLVSSDGSINGENVVVGGANNWKYSSFVNYDFFPSRDFPILVYFKETQTPESNRVEAPEIIKDGLDGQAHYFPAISRSDQLIENFEKNNCKHLM